MIVKNLQFSRANWIYERSDFIGCFIFVYPLLIMKLAGIIIIFSFLLNIKKEKTVALEIKDQEKFRSVLELKLQEFLNRKERTRGEIVETTGELSRQFSDEGEQASLNHNLGLSVGLCESSDHILKKIRVALRRINQGTFGECSECKEDVSIKRLEAVPWQNTCLSCQEIKENQSADPNSHYGLKVDEINEEEHFFKQARN